MTAIPDDAPAWCRRLIAEFDAADARIAAVAHGLTAEQLNRQPRPGAWGVGQCLEHLHISNEQYLPPIAQALEDRPMSVVPEITHGWFGRWFLRTFIEPSPASGKKRAPGKIRPAAIVAGDIAARLLGSNATAKALILRARQYDVNRIRFRNPFVGVIRFTVGTGFDILARHQHRHLLQAERARAALPPA